MRILIFTNNNEISEQIRAVILNKYPKYNIEVAGFHKDAESLKTENFDVVFLDDFSGEKGTVSAFFIKKTYPESKIIIMSDDVNAVSELMLVITPFGVIEKPVCSKKIYRYLEAVKSVQNETEDRFFYTEKGRKRSLPFSSILYLESKREKLIIRTTKSTFSLWMKISEAEPLFPDYFVRCHNSFLVNMKYVAGYEKSTFRLINGQEIIISRSKKEETMEKFYNFRDSAR